MSRTPKLAIVVSHPIQHFAPVYKRIGESGQIDLVVFYHSDAGAREHHDEGFGKKIRWDIDLLSGYRSIVLSPGASVSDAGFWQMDSPRLSALLDNESPDAVMLYGYASRMQWRARTWARAHKRQLLYFSDSSSIESRQLWKRVVKAIPVRYFFSAIDVFLTVGERNAEYLTSYGADPRKMRRCPLSVDVRRFSDAQRDIAAICDVREKYGISGSEFVVLFSGKLCERKRPLDLLHAAVTSRIAGHPVVALFVGSGELGDLLEAARSGSSAPEAVRFAGFVNQQDLPVIYCASNTLAVTSSRDPHPLVVTEAAACGLPIIASSAIGCIGPTDTVQENRNGLVYPCGDVSALQRSIERLMASPELCRQMTLASREIAATQDVSVAAQAIEEAVLGAQSDVK